MLGIGITFESRTLLGAYLWTTIQLKVRDNKYIKQLVSFLKLSEYKWSISSDLPERSDLIAFKT